MNRIDSKGIPRAMSQGGIPFLSMRFQASFRPSKMPLGMINRIDRNGIPPALSQGEIPFLSMRFQASFRPSKMPPKMMNRIDSKGIPPALSQGEYPSYLYGSKQVSDLVKCHLKWWTA